jgi:energy-converting hydrogenase Eha subunit C
MEKEKEKMGLSLFVAVIISTLLLGSVAFILTGSPLAMIILIVLFTIGYLLDR